jgi:hypothetical protein
MTPDLIVLHEADNVGTALRSVSAGTVKVMGPRGALPDLTLIQEIHLGHKAALRPIAAGELIVKHGQPIGRATAAIASGEHVHVHNVISLSRETDVSPAPAAVGDPQ